MAINRGILDGDPITIANSDRVKPSLQAALLARRQPAVRGGDVELIDGVAHDRLMHRSEEHTSELQSLMRISYAVFCLKKKTQTNQTISYLTLRRYDHVLNYRSY